MQDVDFGKNYWVDRNKIRFLRQDFVENRVPACGIFAKLANVIPDPHVHFDLLQLLNDFNYFLFDFF